MRLPAFACFSASEPDFSQFYTLCFCGARVVGEIMSRQLSELPEQGNSLMIVPCARACRQEFFQVPATELAVQQSIIFSHPFCVSVPLHGSASPLIFQISADTKIKFNQAARKNALNSAIANPLLSPPPQTQYPLSPTGKHDCVVAEPPQKQYMRYPLPQFAPRLPKSDRNQGPSIGFHWEYQGALATAHMNSTLLAV